MSRSKLVLLAVGVLAVSWSAPLVRLAGDVPAVAIGFYRTAAAALLLLPFAIARHRDDLGRLDARHVAAMVAAGGFLALHFGTWITSVNLTTVASAALLVNATPVFVALGSVVLGERLAVRAWGGIAVAIAGGALVAGADLSSIASAAAGNMLALAGAVTVAGYLLVGRSVRRRVPILVYATVVYGACAVFLLATAVASGAPLWGYGAATWLSILGITVGPQLLGHTTFNFLLENIEATKVTIAIMGEPVGSALIAAVLFAEIPGWLVLPGGVLLLAGIALVVGARGRPEPAPVG